MIWQLAAAEVQSADESDDLESALADNLYAGYIKTQEASIKRLNHHDSTPIPADSGFPQLERSFARDGRAAGTARPRTFGEARSIPGLTPAALSTLLRQPLTAQLRALANVSRVPSIAAEWDT